MKKILAVCLVLCISLPASAACVWSSTGSTSAKAVCADGDEVAPTLVTEGLGFSTAYFSSIKGFSVTAEADSGQTITSGTFKAYLWDPNVAAWARAPDLDLTVPVAGERRVTWSGFEVTSPLGRVAFVPSVVVLSSGGVTVYLSGS